MKLRKKILLGAMGGLMCLSLAACGNKTVATTNAGKITQSAFYNRMKKSATGKQTLQQMILDKLLNKDYGNDVSNAQVNSTVKQMQAQYGSQFSAMLQQQGMTPEQLKQNIRGKLLLREAVKHHTDFTSAKLKKQFKTFEPKVTVDQISTTSQSKAKTVISKLKSGDSFSSLAKKYSEDPTKKDGGRLAPFDNTSRLNSKFKDAAFNLSNGEYTKTPVKTKNGYQIIKMVNKPQKGTYRDNKNALENQITDKRMKHPKTIRKAVSYVLRNGNVDIQDQDLKNILANYMS